MGGSDIAATGKAARETGEAGPSEVAVRQRERELRALAAVTHDVVFRMSPDWSEMRWLEGRGFLSDTEQPTEDWLDVYISPADRPEVMEAVRKAIETKSVFDREHRVRRMDGTLGWTHSRAVPILDDAGEIAEWIGAATDITERQARDEALRESEEHQRFLLEFSDALRAESDADAVADRAIRMLSEQMQLDRCYVVSYRMEEDLADVTHQLGNDRVPALPGTIRLSDFPAALRDVSEQTLVVEDDFERRGLSEAEQRNSRDLGMRAFVAPTLRKGGNHPLWSMVAISARPRRWTPGEVALAEEVAERTWTAMQRACADAALRKNEERLRLATTATRLAVSDWDLETDRVVADARFREILGLEAAGEILGSQLLGELVHPDDREWVSQRIEAAMSPDSPGRFELEHRAITPVGERWLLTVGEIRFAGEGRDRRAVRIVGNHLDITERKGAEEASKRSEALYRAIASHLPAAAVYVFDHDLRFLVVEGEGSATPFGFADKRELEGLTVRDLDAQTREIVEPRYRRLLAGESFELETEYHGRVFHTTYVPIVDDAGHVVLGMAVVVDVTERSEHEARQTFLLRYSDALRSQLDAQSIKDLTVSMLAEQLGTDRCWISEASLQEGISYVGPEQRRSDLPPMPETYRLSDYPETMTQLATQPMVIADVANDPRFSAAEKTLLEQLQLRALLVAPLREETSGVVWALAAAMATPRAWTQDERLLLEDVGERAWAAIARARVETALRQSEERHHLATEASELGVFEWDLSSDRVTANERFCRWYGVAPEEPMTAALLLGDKVHPEDLAFVDAQVRQAMNPGSSGRYSFEYRLTPPDVGGERWLLTFGQVYFEGAGPERAPVRVFGANLEVTERKRAEARQAFLLKLSDDFRACPDGEAIARTCVESLARYMRVDRCYITEMSTELDQGIVGPEHHAPDLPPISGVHSYRDYPDAVRRFKSGENMVVGDVTKDPALTDLDKASIGEGLGLDAILIANLYRGAGNSIWALTVGTTEPRDWTAGDRQLVEDVAERTWAAIERARVDSALRASEAKYRTLFDSIDEGFCTFDMIYDDAGLPIDYRFVEYNPAFERHTGLTDAVGRTIRELVPDQDREWFEIYGRVASSGEPVRVHRYGAALQRWYEVYAFRIGDPEQRRVAALFSDVSDRKGAEEALRASEARQAFLLDLSDRLRQHSDPAAIQGDVAQAVGRYFGAIGVEYAEVDCDTVTVTRPFTAAGYPVLEGLLPLDAYAPTASLEELRRGRPVLHDAQRAQPTLGVVARAPELGTGATAYVPLVREGTLAALLAVHLPEPHTWTTEEQRLLEEVAERTWPKLARARAESALRESELRYRQLFGEMMEGFVVMRVLFDEDGRAIDARYQQVNPAFAELTGLEDVVGRTVSEVLGAASEQWLDRWGRVARSGVPERFVEHSAALRKWYEASVFRISEPQHGTVAMLFNDASERVLAERSLQESERRYRLLTESLPDVAWSCEAQGGSLSLNRRGAELFGAAPDTMQTLIDAVVYPGDRDGLRAAWQAALDARRPCEHQCRLGTAGHHRWFLVRGAPLLDEAGNLVQWVGTMTDIHDQKRREQEAERGRHELQHRVHHDPLTGLPNRLLFEDRLRLAVAAAARHERLLAVLFVDLDGFKLVNDRLGHAAGDVVLEETAARLRGALRGADTLARLHGDEFAILLPEVRRAEDAGVLAQTLLGELERPIAVAGARVVVGASIGISVFPQDGSTSDALLRGADVAMYRAKADGKHEIRFFDASMRAPSIERAALVEQLEGALGRGDITLTYQPQWDSRLGIVTAFEALLHWRDERLGVVPPDRLAHVAEERGAFGEVVAWSLDAACRTARLLGNGRSLPVRVALNVTGTRLMRSTFVPQLERALEAHGLVPGQFELELTLEPSRFEDPGLRRRLALLRERNVRIVFDRFGGAPGILAPLLDLPVDAVKLDPAVVHRAAADARFRSGLRSVITLLQDVDLEVLALGIETQAQRDIMLELGCSRLQGYLLGPPAGAEAATEVLRREGAGTLFRPLLEESWPAPTAD